MALFGKRVSQKVLFKTDQSQHIHTSGEDEKDCKHEDNDAHQHGNAEQNGEEEEEQE